MGRGGGGMKRSVEKKDRAGSRMKKTQKRSWLNSKMEENGEMRRNIAWRKEGGV